MTKENKIILWSVAGILVFHALLWLLGRWTLPRRESRT